MTKVGAIALLALILAPPLLAQQASAPAAPQDDASATFIKQMAAKDQEIAALKRQASAAQAAVQATPEAKAALRARTLLEAALLFQVAEESAEAEACEKRKGAFSVLVFDGRMLTVCQLKARPSAKK